MKKILYVATGVKLFIMHFNIPHLKMLKELGWETAVAARNDYEDPEECAIPFCDAYYNIPFARFPFKSKNLVSYRMLKKLINEGEYDIIHCHTPVGAMLTRLASIGARKRGARVIYTAHGFHFFKGAPLLNWLVYFPLEWLCSFMTDTLITINHEDYMFAKKHMHAKRTVYVPGVGIDLDKFGTSKTDTAALRRSIGVSPDKVWVLSIGELIPRKNQEILIRAVSNIPDAVLTIVGNGKLQEYLTQLISELKLEDRVKLLGYRKDVPDLCHAADVFAFSSFQEGLPLAVMEAMASGLPCVASRIRGNVDLLEDGMGAYMCSPDDEEAFAKYIEMLAADPVLRQRQGGINKEKVSRFDVEIVNRRISEIYSETLQDGQA